MYIYISSHLSKTVGYHGNTAIFAKWKSIIIFCTVHRKFKCQLSISYTNCDKNLLQITTAKLQTATSTYYKLTAKLLKIAKSTYYKLTAKLLQITTKFYCKLWQLIYYKLRQFYYKLRQLLQIATSLLQITTAISNCDNYYKLWQNTWETSNF